jgi:hypothetical protein
LHAASGRLAFHDRAPREHYYSMSQLAERLAARIGNESVHGVDAVADHRPQYAWHTRDLFAAQAADVLARVRRGMSPGRPDRRRSLWDHVPEPTPHCSEKGRGP